MQSSYFYKKIKTQKFRDDLLWSFGEIIDKKILLYGAGKGFEEIFNQYPFQKLNLVAIADKKFNRETKWHGIKAIPEGEIKSQNYDILMITDEDIAPVILYVREDLGIHDKEIRTVFNEQVKDERASIIYLEKYKFEKSLKNLEKKLAGKPVVIYGAGIFFEAAKTFYDISGLNIIAISDKRFEQNGAPSSFYGYKTVAPDKIVELAPDFVVVATKYYVNLINELYCDKFNGTKIKIKPLLIKPFWTLVKEIS